MGTTTIMLGACYTWVPVNIVQWHSTRGETTNLESAMTRSENEEIEVDESYKLQFSLAYKGYILGGNRESIPLFARDHSNS